MKYDFVEIGTSDFDTLSSYSSDKNGISIDAVFEYSDRIEKTESVKVLNVAISDFDGTEKVYYIKPEDIETYSLPDWIRGCGRIGKKHPYVIAELEKRDLLSLYLQREIEVLSFSSLCEREKISQIYFLKIDAEGSDYRILKSLLSYGKVLPEIIEFEMHSDLEPEINFNSLLSRFYELGYQMERKKELNVVLRRSRSLSGDPRITVVATYDENYREMAEITANSNFKSYCEMYGFDLHLDQMSFADKKRDPQWHKIKLLIDLFKTKKSDWFFFIDTDCLFMDFSQDLSSFIDEDYLMVLGETKGAPDFSLEEIFGVDNLLSAQILIKNTSKSLEFLEKVWEAKECPDSIEPNEFDHEMRQMRILFSSGEWEKSVKILNSKALNSFWYVNNPHVHNFFPHINENGWNPGDFIVHVVGYPTKERVSILSELSRFVGGKISFVEMDGSKVWLRPLLNLLDVRIDMYNQWGEFVLYWEFSEMKKDVNYFLIFDDTSLLLESFFVVYTKKEGEISRVRANTIIQKDNTLGV